MIRFHLGSSFHATSRARVRADEVHGTLGIEVDGVDITRGRLEDALVPTTAALVEAVARLVEGKARTAALPFDDGSLELILARSGDAVLLSLVSLPRPARVLVRDLEVPLESLARAAATCGTELLGRLAALETGQEACPATQRLRQACTRLARAPMRPAAGPGASPPVSLRSRPQRGGSEAPALGFDLRDDDGRLGAWEGGDGLHPLLAPGHVYVHAPDGEELCAVAGSPFLLLRDLADVGLRLLDAAREGEERTFSFPLGWEAPQVEVDLRGGAFTVAGRTLRCPPDALARALFAGALDLGGAAVARHPRLAGNPYLASLIEEARERIALCDQLAAPTAPEAPVAAAAPRPRVVGEEAPLAPGTLRRVSLRVAWGSARQPIRALHGSPSRLWALGRKSATPLHPATGVAGPLLEGSVATGDARAPLFVADGGALTCHDPAGRRRWATPAPWTRLGARWELLSGGFAAVVADGATLAVVSLADGTSRFKLVPPAAASLALAAAGPLAVAAADNGVLYAVDASRGELAWRVPLGALPEAVFAWRDRIVVRAAGALLGFAAADGTPLFRVELPVGAPERLLPVPGGWVVAGVGRAGGEVVGFAPDGRVRWHVRPNLGAGAPALLRVGGALYARGDAGIARIERGRVRWNVPCDPGGAPAALRGLLALPGEELRVVDAATGRPLLVAGATSALPHADRLQVAGDLLIVADREGDVAAMRLAGALAVVR